jgi:hypothetical protein
VPAFKQEEAKVTPACAVTLASRFQCWSTNERLIAAESWRVETPIASKTTEMMRIVGNAKPLGSARLFFCTFNCPIKAK